MKKSAESENVVTVSFGTVDVDLDTIVDQLKLAGDMIVRDAAATIVIDREAERLGLSATPLEIQAEADKIRQSLGLESAADTLAWLAAREWGAEDLARRSRQRVVRQKFKEHLGTGRVLRYFHEHHADFDHLFLSAIVVDDAAAAEDIFHALTEQGADFAKLAAGSSTDPQARVTGGYLGDFLRSSLPPALDLHLFGAEPGQILPPIETDEGFAVFKLVDHIEDDPEDLRDQVLEQILTDWIDQALGPTMCYCCGS